MTRGRCPVCSAHTRTVLHTGLTDRTWFRAPGSWTLHRCRSCDSAYLDPVPSAEALAAAYASYYTHETAETTADRLRPLQWALVNGYLNSRYRYAFSPATRLGALALALLPPYRERADRWVRHLERPGGRPRLLDVGCGDGAFLARMRAGGWEVHGVEPDPVAAARVERAGIGVECANVVDARLPDGHFDAVTMNHVLEHAPDPIEALASCHRLLGAGGVLSLATPNLASTGHELFGRDWIGLDAPRHLVLFTPASLTRALERVGFRVSSPRPSCRARWSFSASEAIARGEDPIAAPPPLPPRLRSKARAADLRALADPSRAEEIVLLAEKPEA